MRNAILTLILAAAASNASAANYTVSDVGDFAPAGHRVEFADRFGWDHYKVKFDFGLDEGRTLSKKSNLVFEVTKRDGSTWKYACKAKGSNPLVANINYIHMK